MEFKLTYAGPLYSYQSTDKQDKRAQHVHRIRKVFHSQLKQLWRSHPVLVQLGEQISSGYSDVGVEYHKNESNGFDWRILATKKSGLICKIGITMLRSGPPGQAIYDIDNRLKVIFDALRMAQNEFELGKTQQNGRLVPSPDEFPFYVLLEDDALITHVSLETDMLLEPVLDTKQDTAVRILIHAEVRPYNTNMSNLDFA